MSCKEWKFDCIRLGPAFIEPSHVAIARLFEDGDLKALIGYRGTKQKSFYTVRRFRHGVGGKATGRFSLEEAMTAAENPAP